MLDVVTSSLVTLAELEQQNEVTHRHVRSESYMSSREWLERNGLKAKRLDFYDILANVAFKHTDGVVDLRQPPRHELSELQTDAVRVVIM